MQNINTIRPEKSEYLQMLTSIANPPKSLCFIEKVPETRRPTVAIVLFGQTLTMLELTGKVKSLGANIWTNK